MNIHELYAIAMDNVATYCINMRDYEGYIWDRKSDPKRLQVCANMIIRRTLDGDYDGVVRVNKIVLDLAELYS